MKTKNRVEFKNLLVTGGCGFIGSNFIRYLINNKDFSGRIINVDKLTYAGNPENLTDIASAFASRYIFQKVDICDAAKLEKVFVDFDIDAVCHFAAESHVDRSKKIPVSSFRQILSEPLIFWSAPNPAGINSSSFIMSAPMRFTAA